MDSKVECDQLNLAHIARKKYKKEETKTNKRQCPLWFGTGSRSVNAVQKKPRRLWMKGFVKEMSFKSGVKGQGSDRW